MWSSYSKLSVKFCVEKPSHSNNDKEDQIHLKKITVRSY